MDTSKGTPTRVGIYLRVSKLDNSGVQDSTEHQLREIRRFLRMRLGRKGVDWIEARIWEDEARSAYRDPQKRKGFKQARKDIRNGAVDIVVVWKLDRFVRRVSEMAEVFEEMKPHDVGFMSKVESHLDTTSLIGEAIVKLFATLAEIESATTSLRIQSRVDAWKAEGRPIGNAFVPGFWDRDLSEINEVEQLMLQRLLELALQAKSDQQIARQATQEGLRRELWWTKKLLTGALGEASDVDCLPSHVSVGDPELLARSLELARAELAEGTPMRVIARMLNERRWRPLVKPVESHQVWRMLGNPHVRGKLSHKGALIDGAFPAILDPAQVELASGIRRLRVGEPGDKRVRVRKALISSRVIRCGRCDGPMSRHRDTYRCVNAAASPEPKDKRCPGVVISALRVEQLISNSVVAVLGDTEVLSRLMRVSAADPETSRELTEQLQDLRARADLHARDLERATLGEPTTLGLSEARLQSIVAALDDRIKKLLEDLSALAPTSHQLPELTSASIAQQWNDADLAWRRELVEAALTSVRIRPPLQRTSKFDPRRVEFKWVDEIAREATTLLSATALPWARNHDACKHCGTIEAPHGSHGLCVKCYIASRRGNCAQCGRCDELAADGRCVPCRRAGRCQSCDRIGRVVSSKTPLCMACYKRKNIGDCGYCDRTGVRLQTIRDPKCETCYRKERRARSSI